ncbi:hypothetical protein EAX61_10925 [Dokdonia sinensis]|uniref:RHS repeat-associated core domain-containing protein n=1 Tax=Dokdonia sinensis TaxID=2479847 RepID=A0A3M0G948_9FLAO|nr:hypothetical protein [Dokdonia sinensis]RMB57619.1 hypothetical protein EAX61_10925 [Dokdonia sinensis]
MKKLLALAVILLGGITAQANQVTDLDHNKKPGIRYNHSQPITFVQKGIRFFVYTNGTFDFELPQHFNSGRRGYGNYNAPGTTYGVRYPYRSNRLVRHDIYGNITQVGRNVVFYNRRGAVRQIGSVAIRYHKGRLDRIGNMHVNYDRWGRINELSGRIYHDHTSCGICGINGCTANHFDYGYNQGSYQNWDYHGNLGEWGRRDAHHNDDKKNKKNRRGD